MIEKKWRDEYMSLYFFILALQYMYGVGRKMHWHLFLCIKVELFYTLNGDQSYKVENPPPLELKQQRRKPACKHPYET